MNRGKDLIATTDAHHRPVRVRVQRPGMGLQAKRSESLCAQNSAVLVLVLVLFLVLVTKTGVELGGLGFKNFVHKYSFIVSELLSYI